MSGPKAPPLTVPDPEGEFPFAAEDYALHLASAVAQIRDTALDAALRPLGLNAGRYRVLGALTRFGDMGMTELAGFTLMDRTTLTRIADHLVADELVARKAAARDRRQVLLEISDAGRALHRAALPEVFAYNRSLLAGLAEPDVRASARTMKLLVGNLAPNETMLGYLIHYARIEGRDS